MKFFLLLVCALVYVSAKPRIVKRQANPFAFELPSNASIIVGDIRSGFDCSGLQYGYYADPNNNCQIFHICLPFLAEDGTDETRMWSFLCGEGTVFDQAQLVCNYPEFSLPCGEAEGLYNINDYFRAENVEREFRDGLNNIF